MNFPGGILLRLNPRIFRTPGVKEYCIVDASRGLVVLLRRGKSDWIEKRLGAGDVCTTKLLPGFKLACKTIFDAAADADDNDE